MRKFLLFTIVVMAQTCLVNAQSGQDIMLLHVDGQTIAVDTHNVDSVTVTHDSISIRSMTVPYQVKADSITFASWPYDALRVGWWGDIYEGESFFHYKMNPDNIPQAELLSSDSICQTVDINVPNQFFVDLEEKKVGRKWRYVKNTLTGRRQFTLSTSSSMPFGKFTINNKKLQDADYSQVGLTSILGLHKSNEVSQVLNYWYNPTYAMQLPPSPVFGRTLYGIWYYIKMGEQDSISIEVVLRENPYNDLIVGDSIIITFPDKTEAKNHFEMMDTHNDEFTNYVLFDNVIVIVENFSATIEEVRRWLVRFDLDLCCPMFIEEE